MHVILLDGGCQGFAVIQPQSKVHVGDIVRFACTVYITVMPVQNIKLQGTQLCICTSTIMFLNHVLKCITACNCNYMVAYTTVTDLCLLLNVGVSNCLRYILNSRQLN